MPAIVAGTLARAVSTPAGSTHMRSGVIVQSYEETEFNLGLILATLYLAFAIYALLQAMNCYAYLCYTVLIYPALPWIFLFGDLFFENRTPGQLLLFEWVLRIVDCQLPNANWLSR